MAINKIKVKGVKKLDDGYGLNFKPFKINNYVYTGAKVSSSSKEYVKLEITLIAKNGDGDDRSTTFGLLENGTVKTLRRKNTFGTELFYKLSTVVQHCVNVVKKVRDELSEKEVSDGSDKTQDESADKETDEDNSCEDDSCMVTDCNNKAVVPNDNPFLCEEHERVTA